jgi:hypothetical protein
LTGKSVVELFLSQDPVYFPLLPDTRLPRTLIPDLEKAHKRKRMDLVVKIFCPTRSSNQEIKEYINPQTQGHKRKRMDLVVKIICPTRSSNQEIKGYINPQTQGMPRV